MKTFLRFIALFYIFFNHPIQALNLTDQFSIDFLSSGAVQCENDNSGLGYNWMCRSAGVQRHTITYSPTSQDRFVSELGFAGGNSLNDVTPFNLQPWNADLEDAVKHINGRNRSFILTAFYAHTFNINENNSIVTSSGIVDSTDFFITNVYANDEYSQFMSGPLSFGQNVVVPSYDYGTILQWFSKKFTVTAVYMDVGKNTSNTNHFDYYAIQFLYKLNTPWGQGHYRFMLDTTSSTFTTVKNFLKADSLFMLSFDQELGPIYGGWLRLGKQSRGILQNFAHFLSGGLNVKGKLWGREKDDLGIGIVHVDSGSYPFTKGMLVEAYYRYTVNKNLEVSPDIQYQINHFPDTRRLKGIFPGFRASMSY